LRAIETGFVQRQIQESAYRAQKAVDDGTQVVVGVNRYATDGRPPLDTFALDPDVERRQTERVQALRARRDAGAWRAALDAVAAAARGRDNLVPPIVAAVDAGATVGEIADTMRDVFGEFREVAVD
jgi:methylmalonyl-CoA mutase N-terminal domain/subunit